MSIPPGTVLVARDKLLVKRVVPGSMFATHPDLAGYQPIRNAGRILRAFWLERPRSELWQLGMSFVLVVDPERGADSLIFSFRMEELADE